MSNLCRILHLEDDKNDAELIQSVLSGEGLACDIVRVDSREDFLSGIEGCGYEIILADFSLPSFDGISALKIAKDKCPDVPFIFVSGALGEELAVETLRMGATDYVRKDRLSRLSSSIKRALGEAEERMERKRAVEALLQSEERYRKLYETVRDIIFTLNKDGVLTSLNPSFEAITGFSRNEWIGKHFGALIHQDDLQLSLDLFDRALQDEDLPVFELRIPTKQGDYKTLEFTVSQEVIESEFVVIGVARDITDQKRLEGMISRAKRMESVAALAGGIAHDFNNILTIIMGYAGNLQAKIEKESPMQSDINQILKSVKRGANLTKSLLVLGKKQDITLKEVDINEVIKTSEPLFLKLLKDVELRVNLTSDKLMVMADVGHIENVLINIAINARDAMPDGGRLSIETSIVEPDISFIKAFGQKDSKKYAMISISDTGTGMDEKTKMKIFEPFFTTKEEGKGTGLGLSMVYGSIKQHNGFIDIQSELGKGTRFSIYLPLIESRAV